MNIEAVLGISDTLSKDGVTFLLTRNLCQDPLELHFGKIRLLSKFPDSFNFARNYARIASASLIRAPTAGNCETSDDHLTETIGFIFCVSDNVEMNVYVLNFKCNNNIYLICLILCRLYSR